MLMGRCLSAWELLCAPALSRSVLLSEESDKILLVCCARSAPGAAAESERRAPNVIVPIFRAVHGMAAHMWALAEREHGTASRAANAVAPDLACLRKSRKEPLRWGSGPLQPPAPSNPTALLSRATEQSPRWFPCNKAMLSATIQPSPAEPPPAPQLPAPSC